MSDEQRDDDVDLGLEQVEPFTPPKDAPPAASARDLETDDDFEPPAPELVEWTPDRAASVVRAMGFVLHHADGITNFKPADHDDRSGPCSCDACKLWRVSEADALEAGAPLARILNRYAPARRLAGVSDEAELALVLGGVMRQELARRGRLVAVKKAATAAIPGPFDGAEPVDTPATPETLERAHYERAVADGAVLGPEWAGHGYIPPPPSPFVEEGEE